jgi:hypothetical protein
MLRGLLRFSCLALAGALLLGPSVQAKKSWTVICYFVGDDDADNPIENSQINDLLELDSVGSSEDVDFIVQMDRGPKLTQKMKQYYSDPNYSGGIRYHIQRDKWISEEKLGEVNMGDPKTLYDCFRWAVEKHPAENYALIINAHGSGILSWRGVGSTSSANPGAVDFDPFTAYDDTDNDTLTVWEIEQVLLAFQDRLNDGKKLGILAFDSCLAMMVEALYQFRNTAEVMIGSPSLIPGTGYAYDDFGRWLVRNPQAGAEEFSKIIVKTFIDSVQSNSDAQVLAAYRLSGAEEIVSTLSRLSIELLRARKQGAKLSFQNQSDYNGKYWDMGRFVQAILDGNTGVTAASNYQTIRNLAQEVEDARRSAAVSIWYDGKFSRNKVGALSLFWPEPSDYQTYRQYYKAMGSSQDGYWDEFLDARELGL